MEILKEKNKEKYKKNNIKKLINQKELYNNKINNFMSYSNVSYDLTKKIDKDTKKNYGIFFTNPNTIQKNLEILKPFMSNVKYVLEPSCGSCEYITQLKKQYESLKITGIEFNKTIYNSIKSFENNNIQLLNENFLSFESPIKYDLIIGNPPYFVMKKNDVDKSYYKYFEGRPNIFILFLIKSLHLLNNNGILSFVLPKSFLNCLYYDNTRKYIAKNFKIIDIFECDDNYIETKQATIIFIVQNNTDSNLKILNDKYTIYSEKYTIFSVPDNILKLKSLYENSSTLEKLGFKVNVGNIVWNQCKKELTSDSSKTLLIYSSDIKNNQLKIKRFHSIWQQSTI